MAGRLEQGSAQFYIDTREIKRLGADLRRGAPAVAVELRSKLRLIAHFVAAAARVNAPNAADGQIKAGVRVRGAGFRLRIEDAAPAAAAFEVGSRGGGGGQFKHPVFGGRGTKRPNAPWVDQATMPYLGPAVDQNAAFIDEAVKRAVDDALRRAGFY